MSSEVIHLFLATELFFPDLPGGLMRFFRYGPGLRARGVIPHVVTLKSHADQIDNEEINGILIHRLDPPGNNPFKSYRPWLTQQSVAMAIAKRRLGFKSVIQPIGISRDIFWPLLKARVNRIGTLVNIGIAPEPPEETSRLRSFAHYLFTLVTAHLISKVVFLSHQLLRQYSSIIRLDRSQVVLIPNGVDQTRFRPSLSDDERHQTRNSLGITPEKKVALFVGGIMPRKGVDILLKAWQEVEAAIPEAILLIVGSNEMRPSHNTPELRDKLIGFLHSYRLLKSNLRSPENLIELGEIDDPAPVYRAADYFVFPSHREGLPNAVLEAMASGLPCLLARFEGIPNDGEELGASGVHYIATDHDPQRFANQMIEMMSSKCSAEVLQMGRSAVELVGVQHNLDKVLDMWARTYLEASLH